jgi:hypothetical protein
MPRAKKAPVAPYNTGHNEKVPTEPGGRAYGARKATEQAIAASPLAGPSVAPAPAGPAPAPPDAGGQVDPTAALAAAQGYSPQGPGLTDPSQNPNEPVTAGLPSGPGVGPEGLAMPDPTQADTQAWATYLPTLEYLASMPGSTASTRNFVRRLRAAMPPSAATQ